MERHARHMHRSYNFGADVSKVTSSMLKDAAYVDPSYNMGFDLSHFRRTRQYKNRYPTFIDYRGPYISAFGINSHIDVGFVNPVRGQPSFDDMWKTYVLETLLNMLKTLREINSNLYESLLLQKLIFTKSVL